MIDQDSPSGSKKKPDSSDSSTKKPERKSDTDEPKPRIVLTFRSEKPGAKSSSMKIVSSEEKHEKVEEALPRRSTRMRHRHQSSEDDNEDPVTPKKDKNEMSEGDETVSPNSKRVTRGRSKDVDNNAAAKKEPVALPTRLSRRIKPTPKVLENEELRIGLESQNNARLGLTDKVDMSPEEPGVCTRRRRSVKSKQDSLEYVSMSVDSVKSAKTKAAVDETEVDIQDTNQVLKLKHLCELGLKARSPDENEEIIEVDGNAAVDADEDEDVIELDGDESGEHTGDSDVEEDQEIDDDTDTIKKLLEEDDTNNSNDSDSRRYPLRRSRVPPHPPSDHEPSESESEYENCDMNSASSPPRRSPRKRMLTVYNDPEFLALDARQRRRRTDPKKAKNDPPPVVKAKRPEDHVSLAANGSAESEAARPEEGDEAAATCTCDKPSHLYAAPDDTTEEPTFCQAIESVDGVRVGCSHCARRSPEGGPAALSRCGPRAPYIRTCALHHRQMARHMCCTICGLFCTQGVFYQCSLGHLFHVECGLPLNDTKRMPPGCPHCGLRPRDHEPVNRACAKVRVDMRCSNNRVFMPDQREQCMTAYLSFTPVTSVDDSPVIPEDLLPSSPVDLKKLCQQHLPDVKVVDETDSLTKLHDAVVAGESAELLIPKIMSVGKVNAALPGCDTCLHAACKSGNVAAVYLLHYAGADLNATDNKARTPLIAAVSALLEKPESKISNKSKISNDTEDKDADQTETEDKEQKEDIKISDMECGSETERASDENLMKVIRYLVAAGCDVNAADPEGMTALHIAAQHGSCAVSAALLSGPRACVDPRDLGGWSPLVWAAENNHADTVKLLLSHGADPIAVDSEGNAAVHWCALAGAARSLLVLLEAEPQAVHSTNTHADTPLHVAAREGHYACVVILLARGAKTDAENSSGSLPVEVCSGKCQAAISLNMQMALALRTKLTRRRLLTADISRGREPYPIPVVNELDDTPLPGDFTYVTSHVMPANVVIDNTLQTMQGCGCAGDDCSSVVCACVSLSVRRWTHGAGGGHGAGARLRPGFPHHDPPMLFTCNDTCGCDAKRCTNRALSREISKGSVYVRTEVFRAGGSRGWGLRAVDKIPLGTLVATYSGELLPVSTADARTNDQYMFALTVKPDLLEQCLEKTLLCVDASSWGGAARFINHSCRPTVACVRVFTSSRDLRLPHVAFFAVTHIAKGQELTFDYGDKFWSVKSKWMRCECGEPECRYPEVKPDTDAETNAVDKDK